MAEEEKKVTDKKVSEEGTEKKKKSKKKDKKEKYATKEEILEAQKITDKKKREEALKKLKAKPGSDEEKLLNSLLKGESVIQYKKQVDRQYSSTESDIRDDNEYIPRRDHQAFYNTNGSIALKQDGTVSASASPCNHLQLSGDNMSTVNTNTSIKTNSYSLRADDIIVNNHKLNNKLYELADFKQVLNTYDGTPKYAGGLTMLGTVLVKAWEPNLKRYVLVRRLINIPVFSPSIGGVNVDPGLKITPNMKMIQEVKSKSALSGQSLESMYSSIKAAREGAIAAQEAATTAKNKKLKEENAKKKAQSMASLTGQDPGTALPSEIAATAKAAAQKENDKKGKQGKNTDTKGKMQPTNKGSAKNAGWNSKTNQPNDPTAYWYKIICNQHIFHVMQGGTSKASFPCNYSAYGIVTNKKSGDNKTPLGTFTITQIEKNNMETGDRREKDVKLPGQPGTFGSYWVALSCGNGIGIHGDYPSEDAKGILTVDSPRNQEPKAGEGSTHGCIRLYNKDIATVAQNYMKTGQYVRIEVG